MKLDEMHLTDGYRPKRRAVAVEASAASPARVYRLEGAHYEAPAPTETTRALERSNEGTA